MTQFMYVKLQFPYELSFLSVFWITSKSNQKYMLDVVNEADLGPADLGAQRQDTERHHGFRTHLFYVKQAFYIWDQWGEVHKMTK